jgi:hypothetical protein
MQYCIALCLKIQTKELTMKNFTNLAWYFYALKQLNRFKNVNVKGTNHEKPCMHKN